MSEPAKMRMNGRRRLRGSPSERVAKESPQIQRGSASPRTTERVVRGFSAVVNAFSADPKVTPPGIGKGFGSRALKVNGKIFAMLSSRAEFVVKLPSARAAELIAAGRAKYFDAGRGKAMKEWAVVTGAERLWIPLAKEARDFVAKAD
jgi:hypothetical protein